MNECSPAEAAAGLAEQRLVLLDIREAEEIALATVPGALCIPMSEIPDRLATLPRDQPLAVLCHHGVRSAHVVHFLERAGLSGVLNITGGIDRWSTDVDGTIPRY